MLFLSCSYSVPILFRLPPDSISMMLLLQLFDYAFDLEKSYDVRVMFLSVFLNWFLFYSSSVPIMFLLCSYSVRILFLLYAYDVPIVFLFCSYSVPIMFL